MSPNIAHQIRRANWMMNKRSFAALTRLPEEVLQEARDLHRSGNYEGAITLIEKTDEWKRDPSAWRIIGLCWAGLKEWDKARESYDRDQQLIALEFAKSEVNIAQTYIAEEEYDQAMKAATRAIDIAPILITAHVAIIAIYNRKQDRESLVAYLRQLKKKESWIFKDEDFLEMMQSDTDLMGVNELMERI